ncbi:MAG: SPOR domain-containing protein [Humidesulfovibrio sp.]|nr:SPOR domain-containing protein [Humidesulfovibrio sp.]
MPGTAMQNKHGLLTALAPTALTALLAATLVVGGCAPRQPIPLDQPRIVTKAPAEAEAKPAPVPPRVKAAKPAQAKAAPVAPAAPAAPMEAEPSPAIQEKATTDAPAAPAVVERKIYVQVGAFGTAMNALGAVAWLKGKGYENSRMLRVEQGQGALFRVQAGPFQDLAAAHKALEVLKPDWPEAFIPLD